MLGRWKLYLKFHKYVGKDCEDFFEFVYSTVFFKFEVETRVLMDVKSSHFH